MMSSERPRYVCLACDRRFIDQESCPEDGTILVPLKEESLLGSMIGSTIADRYLVKDVIGKGSSSVVYAVIDAHSQQKLALKKFHITWTTEAQGSRQVERFRRELLALKSLDHPNIGRLVDFGITEESPFIVIEFIQGESFSKIMKLLRGNSIDEFIGVFSQLCDALGYAHAHDVFHPDLKPNDILIVEPYISARKVKLIDLGKGAAMLHGDNRKQQLTEVGDLFGDPRYISPEVCLGEPLSALSNVYSLGAIMYETITGKPPFEGVHWMATIYQKTSSEPPALDVHLKENGFAPELGKLVVKSLSVKPEDRQCSMDELKRELQSLWISLAGA